MPRRGGGPTMPEKATGVHTVTSGSLCTCVSRTSLCYAVGLFAHSELSHTQHTPGSSLSLFFLVSLSLPPPFFPDPSTRSRSLRAPVRDGARVPPSRSPLVFFPSSQPSHGPSSSQRVFPAAPARPQADSPGRLTELTVSTAGWLASWLAG